MTTTTVAAPPPGDPGDPRDPNVPGALVAQLRAELEGREPFVADRTFIPTGFSRRLLAVLDHATETGMWMIVSALPGDGKSTTLDRFIALHPAGWVGPDDGRRVRRVPVLATRVSSGLQSSDRLMVALAHGLGAVPRLRAYQFREWLVEAIARAGVRLIVIDDAQS